MNIGAEIPFRRSFARRDRHATGSLIFDRERDAMLRKAEELEEQTMRVWVSGHFCKV